MKIEINKDQYIVGSTPFSKQEFIDFIESDMLAQVLEHESSQVKMSSGSGAKNGDLSHNRIVFGAPGAGKSQKLKSDLEDYNMQFERVTFHPDYAYANFVGTYKPATDSAGKITYEYIAGPFVRQLIKAMRAQKSGSEQKFAIVIEEINRANVAAVFGDVFQLLDRDANGASEYTINTSEDLKKHLSSELGGVTTDYETIVIPSNLYLWATMNSADQGVFPMDTAFKRRWDFEYIDIDENQQAIQNLSVKIGNIDVMWNELRQAINNCLSSDNFKINEDKLLSPFFISPKDILKSDGQIDPDKFSKAFKNKVLMYLFEDVIKHKKSEFFARNINVNRYSAICNEFDAHGIDIFCSDISDKFKAGI